MFLAMFIASAGITLTQAVDIPDVCNSLDPDGWMYRVLGCGKETAGGGGSGAGAL